MTRSPEDSTDCDPPASDRSVGTHSNGDAEADTDGEQPGLSGVPGDAVETARRDAPNWEDEYIDRVADRLVFNYDLERDRTVAGERFSLYGKLTLRSQKHFFHPALSYADHGSTEHLFCRRVPRVTVAECERLVALGHDLADRWVDPDEEHYSTEFTFVLVAPDLPEAVSEFVAGFRDRTLLRFGYYGHYEVNLAVVAPDSEACAASSEADVEQAFRLWDPIEREEPGLLELIARRLQI